MKLDSIKDKSKNFKDSSRFDEQDSFRKASLNENDSSSFFHESLIGYSESKSVRNTNRES